MPGDRLDELARVLARPMPRRRMVRLSLGVLVGAAVAPRLAFGQRPTDCKSYCASGTPCPAETPSCCCVDSSERAGAWVVPIGGACHNQSELECCPVKRPDGSQSVIYCDAAMERCTGNGCVCFNDCGAQCCSVDGICLDDGTCRLRCPPDWTTGRDYCCPPGMASDNSGRDCRCTYFQRCGSDCCPFGYVCGNTSILDENGGRRLVCVGPPDARGNYDSKVAFPGGPRSGYGLEAMPRPVPKGLRATSGAVPYEVALIAVADQAIAALAAWAMPVLDRTVRAGAKAPRVSIEITAPAAAHAAVSDLVVSWAQANSQLLAAGRARGKALGALTKGDGARAERHSRDSGRFATAAAGAIEALPAKRAAAAAALRAAGVAELQATTAALHDARVRLERDGLPADVDAVLAGLGVAKAERARVPARLAATSALEVAGGVLLAPLEDAEAAAGHRRLAQTLRSYASAVKRRPLTTTSRRPQGIPRRRDSTS